MRHYRRPLGALAALGVLVIAARMAPLGEWTVWLVEVIRSSGLWGVLLYTVVYAVSTVVLVPGSVLTLAGGFVYGPVYGLLVVVPASLLGATCAFLMGRTVLRDVVRCRLERSPRTRALARAVDQEAFKLVLFLRLSPLVPFNALNYALSLSGIPVGRFVLVTFIGELPGALLYVYLGSLATTAAQVSAGSTPPSPLRTVFYVAGLAATVVAAVVTGRLARRALADVLPEESTSSLPVPFPPSAAASPSAPAVRR